jgi:dipeptidyl aminopeptidase/acylaminoacyl peptidase
VRIIHGLLLLLPLAACAGSSDTDTPAPEPNAAILTAQGGTRIVRHDATGVDTVTLLAEPGENYSNLRPQPGGTLLVFARLSPGGSSPGETYQMTTTGAGLMALAAPGNGPIWSPDGLRAGWLSSEDAGTTIILTNPELSGPDTVALAEAFNWSPDRGSLVITYRPTNEDQEVGTIALNGPRDRVNRTNSPGDDALPAWSPDGAHIAFYSTRLPQPGLYVMAPDGTNQHLLIAATLNDPPVWSPDGTRIAVIDQSAPAGFSLRIVRLDGTEETIPDSLAVGVTHFAWSPTGAHALLVRHVAGGGQRAYLTPSRPTRGTRLPSVQSGTSEAVWVAAP